MFYPLNIARRALRKILITIKSENFARGNLRKIERIIDDTNDRFIYMLHVVSSITTRSTPGSGTRTVKFFEGVFENSTWLPTVLLLLGK